MAEAGRMVPYSAGRHPFLAALSLLTPMLVFVEIDLVGRLFLTEVILLGVLPFLLLVRGRMLFAPLPRMFLMLAMAWLAAQVLTDIIRGTPFEDYSRGWAKIGFFTLNFCAIYMLVYGSRQRMALFALGVVVGGILTFFLNPNIYAEGDPWKFGVGYSLTLLVAVVAAWPWLSRLWGTPAAIMFLIGVFSIVMGSRSLGLVTMLTGLYVLVQLVVARRRGAMARPSPVRLIVVFIGGLFLANVVSISYEYVAVQGIMGADAQQKYERQSQGKYGVLLGGRSEIFASGQAIMDSPIIGHGSWAKDPRYATRLLELQDYGYDVNFLASESDLIPSHSYFFGAWVESGIVGALFWAWVLWLVIRVLSNMWAVREPLTPLIAFVGLLMLWNIPFSPFGATARLNAAYNITLMMFAWNVLKNGNVPGFRLRNRARQDRGTIQNRLPYNSSQPKNV